MTAREMTILGAFVVLMVPLGALLGTLLADDGRLHVDWTSVLTGWGAMAATYAVLRVARD